MNNKILNILVTMTLAGFLFINPALGTTITNKSVGGIIDVLGGTDPPTLQGTQFDPITAPAHSEGLVFYDSDKKTHVAYNDIADVALNIGEENWIRVVNKTGGDLTNGDVVYVSSAQGNRPTVLKAKADDHSTSHGTLGVVTQTTIADNVEGMVTAFGIVRDFNTTGFLAGDELYLSEGTAGEITKTAPPSPNHKVRVGWALNSTVSGAIFVNIKVFQHANEVFIEDSGDYFAGGDTEAALQELGLTNEFFNGTFEEPFNALVTSNGTDTITLSVQSKAAGDLTMRFSDGKTILDCTPAATITLTAGTATIPQANYIYILQSTKAITKSTTQWPSTEHIRIGYFYVQTEAIVQSTGALINQNWNDAIKENSDNMGHLSHLGQWIRSVGAKYFSGCDGGGTSGYLSPYAGGATFQVNSGVITQMHKHTYVAKDTSGTDVALVPNYPSDAFKQITDLNDILVDSTGATLTNRYFNIIIGGVANKGGEYSPLMVKLPSGSYNSSDSAIDDIDSYTDMSMPRQFNKESSTGFLIARITVRNQGDTTFTVMNTQDLRGQDGALPSGSTGGTPLHNFADNQFTIYNNIDPTKIVTIDASGITTGNTRIVSIPDEASSTIGATSEIATTGEITGKLDINLGTGATLDVPAKAHYGGTGVNGDADAIEMDLDAALVGMSLLLIDGFGGVITADPSGTEFFVYDGTAAAAGEALLSSGTKGDFLSLVCVTAGQWLVLGHDGNGWTEATP